MLGIYCRTSIQQDTETSTIVQQRTAGIKFAEENKFEYELYEDEGKSGFKISDDDQDPFNNRPSFTNLINDIKTKKIEKVWVWEHSRLSRNQYASAFIFNIFEKYKITLYENNKELKLDDPQLKFMRQMLDAVAEYERQLIVARTTRGKHKRINEGYRVYQKLYGYESIGKDEKGHSIWKPVESEIETYKFILKRYLEGATLRKICLEVYETDQLNLRKVNSFSTQIGNKLRGYQYTGYQLTIEGLDIYKGFRKGKINSIQVLLDRKYWVKSVPFPLELVSIEDWITINEKLQINTIKFLKGNETRILRADKDIGTGIPECGKCGMKYYSREQTHNNKNTGHILKYENYYHNSAFTSRDCKQRPKSFKVEYLNEILKLFYFYFYIVFDNTNDLIKESQRTIKQAQLKIKENIMKLEKEKTAIENRISKFQKVIEKSSDEIDVIKYLIKNITSSEEKLEETNIILSKMRIDFEIETEKFNQTEREMAYYDVKERVNDWFFKLNVEEQRNELVRIIKKCLIFNHYILIDTGKIVFLFDINQHYVFDMKLLENMNKDKIYKDHFINMKNKKAVKMFNEKIIIDIDLNRNTETRNLTFRYIVEQFGILYSLDDITKVVSFVSMKGFYSQDE